MKAYNINNISRIQRCDNIYIIPLSHLKGSSVNKYNHRKTRTKMHSSDLKKEATLWPKKKEAIVNVWASNFLEEMSNVTSLLDQYTCLTIVRNREKTRK